ncbi:unnamed protein product [Staurois parvus]|uniref:Uncharacterized protein n=1 Tax=Staurois parvus TaxID=386267 RepID=A0ABN9BNU8_9NEOB|nr:unnamed protein product [Staurois parvus]
MQRKRVYKFPLWFVKACFGTCCLEISKRFGRDEISNPGPIFWEQPVC